MNKLIVTLLILTLPFLVGCSSNSASVEGEVVDASGQPISGVIVTVTQSSPLKGYEQFEAATNSAGAFRIKKLYPTSEYVLSFAGKNWETETKKTIQTAPAGETSLLPKPVVIKFAFSDQGSEVDVHTGLARFTKSSDGVITDTETGLEWFSAQEKKMNPRDAIVWVADLTVAGGGWRMPSIIELKKLTHRKSSPSKPLKRPPRIFEMSYVTYVFSRNLWENQSGEMQRKVFYFLQGHGRGSSPLTSNQPNGVLAVRSPDSPEAKLYKENRRELADLLVRLDKRWAKLSSYSATLHSEGSYLSNRGKEVRHSGREEFLALKKGKLWLYLEKGIITSDSVGPRPGGPEFFMEAFDGTKVYQQNGSSPLKELSDPSYRTASLSFLRPPSYGVLSALEHEIPDGSNYSIALEGGEMLNEFACQIIRIRIDNETYVLYVDEDSGVVLKQEYQGDDHNYTIALLDLKLNVSIDEGVFDVTAVRAQKETELANLLEQLDSQWGELSSYSATVHSEGFWLEGSGNDKRKENWSTRSDLAATKKDEIWVYRFEDFGLSGPGKGQRYLEVFDGSVRFEEEDDGDSVELSRGRYFYPTNSNLGFFRPPALDVLNWVREVKDNPQVDSAARQLTLFFGGVSKVNGRTCKLVEIHTERGIPRYILYVDDSTGIITKMESRIFADDSSVSEESIVVLDDVKVNVAIDESVFHYTPPEGAELP